MPNEKLSSEKLNDMNNMILTVNDFGPINHAEIKINKINVIAGKNSTGKSTASKLLYCFLRSNASDRQVYALESIRDEIYELQSSIESDPFFNSDSFKYFIVLRAMSHIRINRGNVDVDKYINDFYEFKKEFDAKIKNIDSFSKISILNQFNTVESLIRIIDEKSNDLFSQLMENLIASEFSVQNPKKIKEDKFRGKEYYSKRKNRDIRRVARDFDYLISFLNSDPNLRDLLSEEDIQKIKNSLEDLSSKNSDRDSENSDNNSEEDYAEPTEFAILSNLKNESQYKIDFTNFLFDYADWLKIENVYYLDSFSIFDNNNIGPFRNNVEHVTQIRNIFRAPKQKRLFDSIIHEKIINIEEKINEIIGGNFSFIRGIKFNSEGESFEMKNTASGIKQIGLIQMLLDKRVLNENSFLIIDEPEVNLHPEWQVKFAEILVLLAKDLDVTLYINSHSPMFIEAINTYTEVYDFNRYANYYLFDESEEVENKYDIERIDPYELYRIYDNLGEPFDYLESIRIRKSADR